MRIDLPDAFFAGFRRDEHNHVDAVLLCNGLIAFQVILIRKVGNNHAVDAACLTLPAEILETILHDGVQVAHQYQRDADICADLFQLAEELAERHTVAQGLCGCVLNDGAVGHRVAERDTDFNHLYSFPF